jgi:hypothetical protein
VPFAGQGFGTELSVDPPACVVQRAEGRDVTSCRSNTGNNIVRALLTFGRWRLQQIWQQASPA